MPLLSKHSEPPSVVRIGSKYLNDTSDEVINIASITVHPEFHEKTLKNDIAIIKLKDYSR